MCYACYEVETREERLKKSPKLTLRSMLDFYAGGTKITQVSCKCGCDFKKGDFLRRYLEGTGETIFCKKCGHYIGGSPAQLAREENVNDEDEE